MGCANSKKPGADVPTLVKTSDVTLMEEGNKCTAEEEKAKQEAAEEAAREAEEKAAATRLQASIRGKADRLRVENLKHPCTNYRINMKAETFGTCIWCADLSSHCGSNPQALVYARAQLL